MQSGPGVFKGDLLFLHEGRRHLATGSIRSTSTLPALSAHRRVRLFLHHRRHARGRQAHRRAGDHHEGARSFPDERGPGDVHRLSAAGARRNPLGREGRAPHETAEAVTLHPAAGATDTIVQFASGLRYADLSDEVRYYARRHLLDTVGVMIAGAPGDVATNAETMLAGVRRRRHDSGARPREAPRPARRRVPRRHGGARHRARRRLPRRLGALRLHRRAGRAQRRLRARRSPARS